MMRSLITAEQQKAAKRTLNRTGLLLRLGNQCRHRRHQKHIVVQALVQREPQGPGQGEKNNLRAMAAKIQTHLGECPEKSYVQYAHNYH